jgi:hypothetical protein
MSALSLGALLDRAVTVRLRLCYRPPARRTSSGRGRRDAADCNLSIAMLARHGVTGLCPGSDADGEFRTEVR